MNIVPIKRALLSVSDKTGIVDLARVLVELGVEVISTGGTSQLLTEAHVTHRLVEEITGLPEMLSGRVKTLHPKIHGAILGKRNLHAKEAAQHQLDWIDLVVVNFYPFQEVIKKKKMNWEEVVEHIDIGGPTMVRGAAKNFAWVSVLSDPLDYLSVLTELRDQGGLTEERRKHLAEKAFALTAHYDAMIHQYFEGKHSIDVAGDQLHLQLEKQAELRYGENPHQKACAYQFKEKKGILSAKQHQGKTLSYNNILDAEAALSCVAEFDLPACVIVKHANPCGVSESKTIDEAFLKAYQADPISAFGGIIALNRPCTASIADQVKDIFMEVILAPSYSPEALTIFAAKPNLRLLEMPILEEEAWEMRFIQGGMLLQERDKQSVQQNDLKIVTEIKPTQEDIEAMLFAFRVVKHIKSNAILIAKNKTTVGIGAGQVSRIDAVCAAIQKGKENLQNTILASDAFFPFRDSIDHIAKSGIRAIIQPGGSLRDQEVIAACNEHGIAMVFTGVRCFRH